MTIGLLRFNPWNLLHEHIPWLGLTPVQPDTGPLQFVSMLDGIRAGFRLCFTYQERGWNTPLKFITRFSPAAAGNPTAIYIDNVCEWTGFKFDQALDFHDPTVQLPWARAIFREEQGEQAALTITDNQIMAGAALAEGE